MVKLRIFWTELFSLLTLPPSSSSKLRIIESNYVAWASYPCYTVFPNSMRRVRGTKVQSFSLFATSITFQNVSYFAENHNTASPCDEMTKIFI